MTLEKKSPNRKLQGQSILSFRRLPRAIDLAELALAVGALLFSEATEEGSDSTVKWRKWNS